MKNLILTLFTLINCLICFGAMSQKLPNKQEISLHTPANIKIDGKDREWQLFQAYNRSTLIFYSIANDEKNLYVVIQATDPVVINKIMRGMEFSIHQSKNEDKGISITYPVVNFKNVLSFPALSPNKMRYIDVDTSKKAVDSIMRLRNHLIESRHKFIQINGIQGVDSLISVYNSDGIKAAGFFDSQQRYTCEICIALKYLNLTKSHPAKFYYHIVLNGNHLSKSYLNMFRPATGADGTQSEADTYAIDQIQKTQAKLYAKTDFWGEYTLAK